MTRIWRRLPARSRLTIWYVALLAGTLILLGGVGLWTVGQALRQNADDILVSKAGAIAGEVDINRGRLSFEPERASRDAPTPLVVGLDVVRVLDREGRSAFSQEGVAGLPPLDLDSLDRLRGGENVLLTYPVPSVGSVRVFAAPIREKGKIIGFVQVGQSDAPIEALVSRLRWIGLAGLAVALMVAFLGGNFLARQALQPVDEIASAAAQIEAHDLSLRLPRPLVDDELGRLVHAFNGMIERLDAAFQRQTRFTSDASHELRTPLSVIRSQVEVALSSPRRAAYDTRVYQSVCEEIERMSRLVESLLLLARADGGQPIALGSVDLEGVAVGVVADLVGTARERGVELRLRVAQVGDMVGDATLLRQLLVNLVDNALRHTGPGGTVVVAARNVSDGVELSVSDTGEGIPAEHVPRLFERFYRVDRARSRRSGGLGLGLAICDYIARAHGGRLSVETRVGVGTLFTLRLPVPKRLARVVPESPTSSPDDADQRPSAPPVAAAR